MAHAEALDDSPRLFPPEQSEKNSFDLVIANPPYFKIPKSDPRAQAAAAIVHGQPNIYALV
jgi:adenine-specific DNA-methyltransferase